MKTVLTGDLGGTKCRFAVLAEDLSVHAARRVPTPVDGPSFLAMLDDEIAALLATELPAGWEPPRAIGIGTAGVITEDASSVVYAPNLHLDGDDVAGRMEARHGLQTTLINDGRASALGEHRHGFAKGKDPLLVLFYGTGIGIGLVVDGKPYAGSTNAAGEIGHVPHIAGGRTCPCGRRGCYEAYCGGRPMVERAAREVGDPPAGFDRWTVGAIVAAAAADDSAQAILDDAELAAGSMVQSLCTLLNPEAVVLGGGVLQGWPELRGRIEERVRSWCAGIITRELEFVASRGESDAILWGAAEATGAFA
jgi:glucokinase